MRRRGGGGVRKGMRGVGKVVACWSRSGCFWLMISKAFAKGKLAAGHDLDWSS